MAWSSWQPVEDRRWGTLGRDVSTLALCRRRWRLGLGAGGGGGAVSAVFHLSSGEAGFGCTCASMQGVCTFSLRPLALASGLAGHPPAVNVSRDSGMRSWRAVRSSTGLWVRGDGCDPWMHPAFLLLDSCSRRQWVAPCACGHPAGGASWADGGSGFAPVPWIRITSSWIEVSAPLCRGWKGSSVERPAQWEGGWLDDWDVVGGVAAVHRRAA